MVSPDLEHSLSGNYAWGILRHGSSHVAVLAVPGGESSDVTDNGLTFALLWLQRARQANSLGTIGKLRLILPKNSYGPVAHRLTALDPQLPFEVYEHAPALEILEKIDPRRADNLNTWLVPYRESEALLNEARQALDAIVAMAPQAVTLHPKAQSREVWLRFRGLPLARWDGGRVFLEALMPAKNSLLLHIRS